MLQEDELENFERAFNSRSLKKFRDVLCQVIDKELEKLTVKSEKESRYDSPNWAEFQADSIGSQRTYRKLKSILSNQS